MPHIVASDLDLHCLPMSHNRTLGLNGLTVFWSMLQNKLRSILKISKNTFKLIVACTVRKLVKHCLIAIV